MPKIRILFESADKGPFIDWDEESLSECFDTRRIDIDIGKNEIKKAIILFFDLIKGIFWCDITFSWFADEFTYYIVRIAKLLNKPTIVVIGGYEVAKIPEFEYGNLLNKRMIKKMQYLFNHCDIILPVDEGLKKDAINNLKLKKWDNIKVVPTGFDPEKFFPKGEKRNIILTVASVSDLNRLRLKGLDVFVETAKYISDYEFVHIGKLSIECEKYLKNISPSNVSLLGYLPTEKVLEYYQNAKIYCQLSAREGLPTALCEAMLCGCIPVGTEVQGIKTAIGDSGYYAKFGDPKDTALAIRMALDIGNALYPRDRIINDFSLKKRRKQLKEIILFLKKNNID